MTYPPVINHRYLTREQAWGYLASRGFTCGPQGWRNGRWMARVSRDHHAFCLEVWLPTA